MGTIMRKDDQDEPFKQITAAIDVQLGFFCDFNDIPDKINYIVRNNYLDGKPIYVILFLNKILS